MWKKSLFINCFQNSLAKNIRELLKEFKKGSVIILIGISLDIYVKIFKNYYFPVNENYIFYIFSAICTIGTLGSAFISVVISVFSNKCLGFSMKEVINFHSSKIKVGRIIKIALIIIVIAIPFLAIDFVNTITSLAICIIIYIFFKNKELWELIVNDNKLKDLIRSEIQYQCKQINEEVIINWFNRWFSELKISIENEDENGQDEYIQLIRSTIMICTLLDEENQNLKNVFFRLERWISEIFDFARQKQGFVEAYKKVVLLTNISKENNYIDARRIIYDSIKYLQYCDERIISQLNLEGNIENIIWNLDADKELKIYILYQFYLVVSLNFVIKNDFKFSLLNLYFRKVCNFIGNLEISEVFSKIILYILKNSVLQNENKDNRERIYLMLLKQMFVNNRYSLDNYYTLTISFIFRAIYFYAYLEIETISETYRIELQQMIHLKVNSMDNLTITLPRMIVDNSFYITEALIQDSIKEDNIDMFDYFPEGFGAKSSVWTKEKKLEFGFCLYCIFRYKFIIFPIAKYLSDAKISLETKQFICTTILNMFSDKDETLNSSTMKKIEELRSTLETNLSLSGEYLANIYQYLNNELKEIRQKDEKNKLVKINLAEINEELKKLMQEHPMIEFSSQLPIIEEKEYQVLNRYVYSSENIKSAARAIQYAINDIVNLIIKNMLPVVKLEFNANGIKILLEELKKATILIRNYTYIDDLALDKNAVEIPEYKELCGKINSIHYERINVINHYIFLSIRGIKVNADVISYKRNILTDEQCDQFIESFKIADGKYKIDSVVYNKTDGIQFVKKNIRTESAVIKVKTNISEKSGFRVIFK